MRTVLLTLLTLAASGCSLVFMETLPSNHQPQQEPRCTTTQGWALWDTLIAGSYLALGVGTYIQSERLLDDLHEGDPRDDDDISDIRRSRNNFLLLAGAGLSAYGYSAVYGSIQSGECAEARAKHDALVRAQ